MQTWQQTMTNNQSYLDKPITIVLPTIFLICSILSFLWFVIALRKRYIDSKSIVVWLTINVLFLMISVYLVVICAIWLSTNDNNLYDKLNFFDLLAKKIFGTDRGGWIILLIIILTFISIIVSINVVIKFNAQNKRINELNRNLAILKGKIAINLKDTNFDTTELSANELKFLLEEQLMKEKLKIKYKNKLEKLSQKTNTSELLLDTKTLLNIKKNYDQDSDDIEDYNEGDN